MLQQHLQQQQMLPGLRRTCRPLKRHTKRVGTKNDMICHRSGGTQLPCQHKGPSPPRWA